MALLVTTALGAGGTLWFRGELKDCELSKATEANKEQERSRVLREVDEKFTNALSVQAREIKDALNDQSTTLRVDLAKVKSDPNCLRTPAANAFDINVLPRPGDKAGAGPAGNAKP